MMTKNKFEWYGDHAATNFVNTLDERLSGQPEEQLVDYATLIDFTRGAGLIDEQTADSLMGHSDTSNAQAVLSSVLTFREALYTVLRAAITQTPPDSHNLAQVEAAIREANDARILRLDSAGFGWDWQDANHLTRPLWELALAAEQLLLSEPIGRIKKCAAYDCGVLFVDHSRAGGRRWCSMAECGNRYKVQTFRSSRKHN
jgi:predicted RNA-binding Zn ribbon-like protein